MALTAENRIEIIRIAASANVGISQPSGVVELARSLIQLAEEGEAQVIGGVAGKPRNTRKPATDAAPVVAVAETAAANEPEAEQTGPTQAEIDAAYIVVKAKADAALAAAKAKSAADAAAEAATAAASGITQDDIKKVVGKLAVNVVAGGANKVRAILGKYDGATNISTLKPVHYAAAHAEITAVLEAAELAA